MSAYIVDDSTINLIVAMLEISRDSADLYQCTFPSLRYLKDDGYLGSLVTSPGPEMGATLRQMNANAVQQRYPDCDDDNMPGPVDEDGMTPAYKYKSLLFANLSPVRCYKALQCYLYQCAQGAVMGLPLYQALEKYKNALACEIVEKMPEYDQHPWG